MTIHFKLPPVIFWVLLLIFGCFLWMMFGCSTVQKAKQTLDKNPAEAARYCADKFPAKDSIVIKDSVSFDTLYVGSDVVFDTIRIKGDTIVITKTYPPKTLVKTITKTKEVYTENTARIKSMEADINACISDNSNLKQQIMMSKSETEKWKKLAKKRWWFLCIIVSVVAAWTFRKKIPVFGSLLSKLKF